MGPRNLLADEVAHLTIFHRLSAGGARMLVRITGEIDLTTVPDLADALDLARHAVERMPELVEIEVDLREVGFMGAAGVTELVRAQRAGVPLHVVADGSAVTRPLRLSGVDRTLGLRADPDPNPPALTTIKRCAAVRR